MKTEQLKELLQDMSPEEKIGQLLQVAGNLYDKDALVTGGLDYFKITQQELDSAGSILSISGAQKLKELQDQLMKAQPHNIPQIFMLDIINGYETIYPVPIAQGATFEPEMAQKLAEMAAKEGAAAGLHATFSPMVDLVRDARWGRVMESTGEDSYLNGIMGAAMVEGYQGSDVKEKGRLAACVKHMAAYGGAEAGRDYDNVELSERTLREEYLPAYEQAVKAGVKMVMTSFNTLNHVPSTGNKWLMKDVLRGEMGFEGLLISDYGAVTEMINHGFAKDEIQAAEVAINAGVDIEMMSLCYVHGLKKLLEEKKITMEQIDEAAWHVLCLKNDLGLFENPYKDASTEEEEKLILCKEHRELAREAAVKSFVLLKNEDKILPLAEKKETIAYIGPYVDSKEVYGSWSFPKEEKEMVTIREGIEESVLKENAVFAKGAYVLDEQKKMKNGKICEYHAEQVQTLLEEAVEVAKKADKVVLCLGEHAQQTGEAASRVSLKISEGQMELLRRVQAVNSNVVTLIFTGRPLELQEIEELSKAVMVVWFPGTESGNAIASVLSGECEPGGRVTMSFPYKTSQLPCYYNRFRTGRPNNGTLDQGYVMGYIDQIDKMLHPFGAGMGYTSFSYSEVKLSSNVLKKETPITASVTLTNTGDRVGTETVQMYVRDLYGSVVRPVKQLRGFQKVTLQPGESKEVSFEVTEEMFRFYDINMDYTSEDGDCKVYIGHDSETGKEADFMLEK